MMENVIAEAADDAALAAEQLNEITDEKVYDAALHEVLDKYYEENLEGQIEQFAEATDERAQETLKEYEEAKEERDNRANLDYETGEVLVTFDSSVTDEEIGAMANRIGVYYEILSDFTIDETLPEEKLKRLKASQGQEFPKIVSIHLGLDKSVGRAEEILQELSSVEDISKNYTDIEPDSLASVLGVNDTHVGEQRYLEQINLPPAWEAWNEAGQEAYEFKETWVAVIDTGMDISHVDLKNVYLPDRSVVITGGKVDENNCVVTGSQIVPMNASNCYVRNAYADYHGTHVAGIIAAEARNNKGVVGIASICEKEVDAMYGNCKIMGINAAYRTWSEKDKTYTCMFNYADVITAIYYATNNGADVINMSLGGQNNSPCYQKAIDYAHANNVVVCASAGNGDYKRDAKGDYIKDANGKCIIDTTTLNVTNYPAACNHVISVANVDSSNQRGELSIYNKFVDIAAPGTEIYNCVLNGGYYKHSGTSMAAPVVSAAAAILRSMYPETTPDEIEEILTKTATDLGTPGKDIYTGSGLLNVGLAVQTLKTRRLSKTYPQKAAVKCVDYQAAKLGWDAVPWAERYVIFRSTSVNGEYTKIKSIHALDWYTYTSSFGRYRFTDKGLATGTTYYYKIRAVCAYQSGFSHSQYCPVISIKCTLNAPTGLTLTPTTGKMKVSWAKVNGAEGYQIWRADTKTGTYKRIHTLTSGATVSYDDTTVKAGKTYYYKIRAYRKPNGTAVFSEYSGIVGKKSI